MLDRLETELLTAEQAIDRSYLVRAIELARLGYGRVSPNPYVGAVVVKAGEVIGEGYHQASGTAHAEVNAINDAINQGHDVKGASLYVTLEPCCMHGKTPACTDLILKSGITRVVTAVEDPNPLVSGKGHEILRNAGIEVETNLLVDKGNALIRSFRLNQLEKRPFVILKAALSLDGKIATQTGDSQWITGSEARKKAHFYRGISDVILIGKGTLIADNPSLTVRYGYDTSPPKRLLLLNNFAGITIEMIDNYHFFDTSEVASMIAFDENNPPSDLINQRLIEKGVTLAPLTSTAPKTVLDYCYQNGLMTLFIEGGAGIYDAFIGADLVDAYLLFYGPKLIGNGKALELWKSSPIESLNDAPLVMIDSVEQLGESTLTIATRNH